MEIEAKFKYTNKPAIIRWLKDNNYKLLKTIFLTDYYYGKNHHSMKNTNDLLRIRNINNTDLELTLKTKASGKNITSRKEFNVKINNLNSAKQILKQLDCKLIKINKSKKEIWANNRASFEFVTNIKPKKLQFIEIEASRSTIINTIASLNKYISIVGEEIFD